MKITVTDEASHWFQTEMGVVAGNGVRFYGKTYGKTAVHHGFSIGLARDDEPHRPIALVEKDGVNYYVNDRDDWFFKGYDLTVDFDAENDGPKYDYQPNQD
ncbi:iron-sulfur cluster biosynthesis protein [Lactobacillus sp. CBA3605]|uniref:HesB/YadR/YfhF family protein n=1 Tax=Lactobacillus sp. CBA3605 TaxID=2099788 RepID=UPI000CFDE0F4|nr:iron-sulfur cluster biosynthesis protein [Lactobacillus sp. CBA3605]AVK62419.1 iron-sulfur cluster biosynthesis protein [Lactobacillus sp. CBA3605]